VYEHRYFDSENYTGDHLHVDSWKNDFIPLIEAIAWVRQDGTMDLFFKDFLDDQEYHELFGGKKHHFDEFMGVFLGNIKSDAEASEKFRKWVDAELIPYRNRL
jgi:hypothetical protein